MTALAINLDSEAIVFPSVAGEASASTRRQRKKSPPLGDGHSYVNGCAVKTAAALLWEKNMLAPSLKMVFDEVSRNVSFNKSRQRVVSIGCGAAHDSVPLLRDGVIVDGVDRSSSMLAIAEDNIRGDDEIPDSVKSEIRLVKEASLLGRCGYAIGTMNFVHQGANTQEELAGLFWESSNLIERGGYLIVVGEHPDYLNKKHSLYKCTTVIEEPLRDGDRYKSAIINPATREQHHFAGSATYWSTTALDRAAFASNLVLSIRRDIEDPHICTRGSDGFPGYQALVFRKS